MSAVHSLYVTICIWATYEDFDFLHISLHTTHVCFNFLHFLFCFLHNTSGRKGKFMREKFSSFCPRTRHSHGLKVELSVWNGQFCKFTQQYSGVTMCVIGKMDWDDYNREFSRQSTLNLDTKCHKFRALNAFICCFVVVNVTISHFLCI